MGKSSSDGYQVARGWRQVGEYAPSPGCEGSQSILTWLAVAVQAVDLLPADVERIKLAAYRAVARAERSATRLRAYTILVVRVFVPTATGAHITPRSWGFFVLERAAAAVDHSDAGTDGPQAGSGPYLIELYIYAEGNLA